MEQEEGEADSNDQNESVSDGSDQDSFYDTDGDGDTDDDDDMTCYMRLAMKQYCFDYSATIPSFQDCMRTKDTGPRERARPLGKVKCSK